MARTSKTKQARIVCLNPDCEFKGRPQLEDKFYKSNKFGMTRYPVCKSCIQKKVDVKDVESVKSVLKDMDLAFKKDLWQEVYDFCNGDQGAFGVYIGRIQKRGSPTYSESNFDIVDEESGEVLEEDEGKKIYSKEWGGKFTKTELEYLNNYYNGLLNDYEITTTNHRDYARKIAKASLAMDEEFEKVLRGEPDTTYKNLRDTFDKLSNSAKFSESQRSANDVGLGSFGVIVAKVEKHTWIPEYEPVDKDTYDLIIEQFSNIEKSL